MDTMKNVSSAWTAIDEVRSNQIQPAHKASGHDAAYSDLDCVDTFGVDGDGVNHG